MPLPIQQGIRLDPVGKGLFPGAKKFNEVQAIAEAFANLKIVQGQKSQLLIAGRQAILQLNTQALIDGIESSGRVYRGVWAADMVLNTGDIVSTTDLGEVTYSTSFGMHPAAGTVAGFQLESFWIWYGAEGTIAGDAGPQPNYYDIVTVNRIGDWILMVANMDAGSITRGDNPKTGYVMVMDSTGTTTLKLYFQQGYFVGVSL